MSDGQFWPIWSSVLPQIGYAFKALNVLSGTPPSWETSFNNAVGVGATADNTRSQGRQRTAGSTRVNRDPISSRIFLTTPTWISSPLRVTIHCVIKDIIWAELSDVFTFMKLQEFGALDWKTQMFLEWKGDLSPFWSRNVTMVMATYEVNFDPRKNWELMFAFS